MPESAQKPVFLLRAPCSALSVGVQLQEVLPWCWAAAAQLLATFGANGML